MQFGAGQDAAHPDAETTGSLNAQTAPTSSRDIIVVGASAGGVEALMELVAALPEDLGAAVFIVLHSHAWSPSQLPEILSRHGKRRATHAIHGEGIQRGRIYIAPPDNHLIVRQGLVEVTRGPKENNHRPSVDALFRSAAHSYGPRVIGVVLSGNLDCGTAGMLSIKARNGIVVAQDPKDAKAPSMPRSVINYVEPNYVGTAREIGTMLPRFVDEPAAPWPTSLPPALLELEGEKLGVPMQVVCPLCSGALTLSEHEGFKLIRCHVGHAFSAQSAMGEQYAHLEMALWSAVRALEETASLAQQLATDATEALRSKRLQIARMHREQAETLRSTLKSRELPSEEARGQGVDLPGRATGGPDSPEL